MEVDSLCYVGMAISYELFKRAHQVKLLALDVDGVLTNGDILYTESGEEVKVFNVKDGHGLSMLAHEGFQLAFITGRNSPITQRRATELNVAHVFQGIKNKFLVLESLVQQLNISFEQVAYVGDDTPDIPVLKAVGLACCPNDAIEDVKRICHFISEKDGGRGAVRDVIDMLLKAHDPHRYADAVASELAQI